MKVKDASEIRRVSSSRPEPIVPREPSGPVQADQVSTSSRAELDAAAAAARRALAHDRPLRLQTIEAALRSGAFAPDPERIAQRILQDAELAAMLQAMLGR